MKRWESCCTDEGDYRSKSPVTDQGQRDRKEKHYSFFARWLRKGHDELRDGLVTYNWYKYPYWEDDKNTFNKFINPFAIGMFMAWASEIPGLNYEDVELSLKHGKQYIDTYKYCNKFYYEQ
uniref:Uncharacterized protein n=1 Tax=Clastoptera arizonana TaxID=38151 RepID=A0A1B6BY39_9HEMI